MEWAFFSSQCQLSVVYAIGTRQWILSIDPLFRVVHRFSIAEETRGLGCRLAVVLLRELLLMIVKT